MQKVEDILTKFSADNPTTFLINNINFKTVLVLDRFLEWLKPESWIISSVYKITCYFLVTIFSKMFFA